jgi:anti-sigma factor RsiW
MRARLRPPPGTGGEGMELGIASAAAITAATYLIGMAVGIASGWAATGVHQSVKQMTKQK